MVGVPPVEVSGDDESPHAASSAAAAIAPATASVPFRYIPTLLGSVRMYRAAHPFATVCRTEREHLRRTWPGVPSWSALRRPDRTMPAMPTTPLAEIVDLDRYPIDRPDARGPSARRAGARGACAASGACDLPGSCATEAIPVGRRQRERRSTTGLPHGAGARHRVLRRRPDDPARRRPAAHPRPLGQAGHGARRHPRRLARARALRVAGAAGLRRRGARDRPHPPLRRPARRAQLHVLPPRRRARLALRQRRLRRHPAAAGGQAGGVFEFAPMLRTEDDRNDDGVRALLAGDRCEGAHHVGRARDAGALPRTLEPASGHARRGRRAAHERRALLRADARPAARRRDLPAVLRPQHAAQA